MQTPGARHLQLAHAVLDWNRRHLRHDARLSEALIGECFAPYFVVAPNGRRYEATHRSYMEFLDGMKRTIAAIDYDVTRAVADDDSVVFAMRVRIDRVDGTCERFDAMLLMAFDDVEKVSLWHEVYVPLA